MKKCVVCAWLPHVRDRQIDLMSHYANEYVLTLAKTVILKVVVTVLLELVPGSMLRICLFMAHFTRRK